MENWAFQPEVLATYAFHYETGEVIPAELVAKIEAAGTFNQGFMTTELESILVKNLCPKVAVVTSAVSATEDVSEICCAVTWDDLVNKTHLLASLSLEALNKRLVAAFCLLTFLF